MIIVKIHGGLGNQMFQYAYARALAERGIQVKIETLDFLKNKHHTGFELDKYAITLKDFYYFKNLHGILHKIYLRYLKSARKILTQHQEKNLAYQPELANLPNHSYITGYFQNERYFSHIRATLLQEFKLQVPLSEYSQEIANLISQQKNSVAVHIRRGDYISAENINIHGFCGLDYYQKAQALLEQKLNEPLTYFVFSNDIDWCREELNFENVVYVNSPTFSNPQEDIYLMSLCQHHIIANSSFSWWGAWLCENAQKIVIAPKQWFADPKLEQQSQGIPCKDWIRV